MTDGFRVHTFTIERLSVTQNDTGGQVRTYSTAARGSLPTSVEGRAVLMSQKEKLEHGVRGDITGWKILVPDTDPQITLEDRVRFDYVDGQSHTVRILSASLARSADAAFYKAMGEEATDD